MNEQNACHVPTELDLHRKSRMLTGAFGGGKRVNVLQFAYLPKKLHREGETLDVSKMAGDVQSLASLRQRQLRDGGDEIGIVPVSPAPLPPHHRVTERAMAWRNLPFFRTIVHIS
jgi:hypothetical protein